MKYFGEHEFNISIYNTNVFNMQSYRIIKSSNKAITYETTTQLEN